MTYQNITQLFALAQTTQQDLPTVLLKNEMQLTEKSREELLALFMERWQIMKESGTAALDTAAKMTPDFISGQSMKQNAYAAADTLSGRMINQMMAYAFSSSERNAAMGKICAAPTAGACGIIPAVLLTLQAQLGYSDSRMVEGLIVASGVGAVITQNATVSGAKGGCQAECGVAAAMAAAACVYLKGGTAEQIEQAICIALIQCMGLICDPVQGLVQLPCSFRNASQSVNALISADMALAGQTSHFSADDVISAMYTVGQKMPAEFRETGEGGIAAIKNMID